ncbi:MAG: hypothetical protein DSO02_01370 [Hadesarchaea archaeon]|nr:MAG: hypothetical protein DSO02_01370 [Hadesarchaea archaeon]
MNLKLAVIGDTHLGAKWGTQREEDPFDQAEEALRKAVEGDVDLILLLGDLFDTRAPRHEVWVRAMRLFTLPRMAKGRMRLVGVKGKEEKEISPLSLQGIPVVALHGNHESRTEGLKNPVEVLEAAGMLIHLHRETVIFEGPGGRVAVHGMSHVPERYSKSFLQTWNPKPVEGAFNVLMLHQSLGQYVFSTEESPGIFPEDLPKGFDLYLCGHVHYRAEASVWGRPLLFPGSTERTQLLPIEAQSQKGFYLVEGGRPRFVELETPRDFFYEEVDAEGMDVHQLQERVRERVETLLSSRRRNMKKLPLIRLRLKGRLARGKKGDFEDSSLVEEFSDRALLVISKEDLSSPQEEVRREVLERLKDARSLEEMTLRLLEQQLSELKYSYGLEARSLYTLMLEGKEGEVEEKVRAFVRKMVEIELGGGR